MEPSNVKFNPSESNTQQPSDRPPATQGLRKRSINPVVPNEGKAQLPPAISANEENGPISVNKYRNHLRADIHRAFNDGGLFPGSNKDAATLTAEEKEDIAAAYDIVSSTIKTIISEIPESILHQSEGKNVMAKALEIVRHASQHDANLVADANKAIEALKNLGTYETSLALKKWGYGASTQVLINQGLIGNYTDLNVLKDTVKPLGSGAVNDVLSATFMTPEGPKEVVLKKEKVITTDEMPDMMRALGLQENPESPKTLQRNILTYIFSKSLEWHIVPNTEAAVYKGELYTVMDMAEGLSAAQKGTPIAAQLDRSTNGIVFGSLLGSYREASSLGEFREWMASRYPNITPTFDPNGRTTPNTPKEVPVAFTYDIHTNIPTASQLVNNNLDIRIVKNLTTQMEQMQFLDHILTQLDRHDGNFFIDWSTGSVQLIDNDGCAPELKEGETAKSPDDWSRIKVLGSHACYLPVQTNNAAELHTDIKKKLTDVVIDQTATPLLGENAASHIKAMRNACLDRLDNIAKNSGQLPGKDPDPDNDRFLYFKQGLKEVESTVEQNRGA